MGGWVGGYRRRRMGRWVEAWVGNRWVITQHQDTCLALRRLPKITRVRLAIDQSPQTPTDRVMR